MKKKDLVFVCIFSTICILIFFTGYFVGEVGFGKEKSIKKIMSGVDEIIEYNEGLDYTQQIFEHCSVKENVSEQFSCVNAYVIENYNYSSRENVYTIDDMFDLGADCKSYSIYYATLAKMMGYDYLFVQLPTHIFTLVYFDEGYCVLDEKIYACFNYGD